MLCMYVHVVPFLVLLCVPLIGRQIRESSQGTRTQARHLGPPRQNNLRLVSGVLDSTLAWSVSRNRAAPPSIHLYVIHPGDFNSSFIGRTAGSDRSGDRGEDSAG